MRYALLVVEGPHDVATVGRVLELHKAIQLKTDQQLREHDVYEFWRRFIELEFPHKEKRKPRRRQREEGLALEVLAEAEAGDLTKRMPIPAFFQLDQLSVAIHSSDGDSKLIRTLERSMENFDDNGQSLMAAAIFCDADDHEPVHRCQGLQEKLREVTGYQVLDHFQKVEHPGDVLDASTRVGIYVFPDNENKGNLENVLLDCAAVSYPDSLSAARDYIGLAQQEYERTVGKSLGEAKKLKATIGCISNLYQPGASNQVSIQKDNWICTETMEIPAISKLNTFISQLLDLKIPQK